MIEIPNIDFWYFHRSIIFYKPIKKKIFVTSGMLCTILTLSQTKDSTTQKEIKRSRFGRKKPTVENKVDCTIF